MQIPALRFGQEQLTFEKVPLFSYKGECIAELSQIDKETIQWDIRHNNIPENLFRDMSVQRVLEIFDDAGKLFAEESLKMGKDLISPEEYAILYSKSTGAPISCPRSILKRVRNTFSHLREILRFQAIDEDLGAYERGYALRASGEVGWIPRGKSLSIVAPSNHPAVNILWAIACAMGFHISVKPSLDDPFTPLRLISALLQAGMPPSMFNFYPCQHSVVKDLISISDLSMVFGGPDMEREYGNTSTVKLFGQGSSKLLVDEEYADRIDEVADLAVGAMMKDGGRGCINLSAIVAVRNGQAIAEAIAKKLSITEVRDPLDGRATLGAFKRTNVATMIDQRIDEAIKQEDARDITALFRKTPRLQESFGTRFLMPTVIMCKSHKSPLFGKEFPFPFITVIEANPVDITDAVSKSLVVSLLSENEKLYRSLLFSPHVGKVYRGLISTTDIDFQQPHDGMISEFLYITKALKGAH